MDELERAAPDHHHRRNGALGQILADRLVVAGAPGEMRRRGCARRPRPRAPPRRRRRGRRASAADRRATRWRRRGRGAKRPGLATTSGTRLAPSKKLILYQRPRSPSISPWSLVRMTIVSSASPLARKRLHEAAELVVDVRDGAEIGAAGVANLGLRHRLGVHRADMAQAARMRIERGRRDRRSGELDVLVAIEVPVALAGRRTDRADG